MSNELNPQPLPPQSVDLGHLTETVTRAVQNALAGHRGTPLIFNPRIIVGIIAEPTFLNQLEQQGKQTG